MPNIFAEMLNVERASLYGRDNIIHESRGELAVRQLYALHKTDPPKIAPLVFHVVILSRFSAAGSERLLPAMQQRGDTSDQEGPFSHSAILPEGVEQDSATIRRSFVSEM